MFPLFLLASPNFSPQSKDSLLFGFQGGYSGLLTQSVTLAKPSSVDEETHHKPRHQSHLLAEVSADPYIPYLTFK